jgi:hypothetical protein
MSWNAYLTDDRGHSDGEWNYTHNCNGMIELALGEGFRAEDTRVPWWSSLVANSEKYPGAGKGAWWDLLNGKTGPEGAEFLDHIIKGLEADPEKYRAMNPENGWGDYDSLVKVLTEMRNAVPEWPTTWRTSG